MSILNICVSSIYLDLTIEATWGKPRNLACVQFPASKIGFRVVVSAARLLQCEWQCASHAGACVPSKEATCVTQQGSNFAKFMTSKSARRARRRACQDFKNQMHSDRHSHPLPRASSQVQGGYFPCRQSFCLRLSQRGQAAAVPHAVNYGNGKKMKEVQIIQRSL